MNYLPCVTVITLLFPFSCTVLIRSNGKQHHCDEIMTFIVHITKMGVITLYFYGHMIEIAETKGAHGPLRTNMQKESVVF